MTLDATARRVATKLIGQFGRTVTLTSVTPGVYNPATGAAVPTSSSVSVKALCEEYKGFDIVNELAKAGDRKFTISAADVAARPEPGDNVLDGKTYTVVAVKAISSGELDALYELQGRLT